LPGVLEKPYVSSLILMSNKHARHPQLEGPNLGDVFKRLCYTGSHKNV